MWLHPRGLLAAKTAVAAALAWLCVQPLGGFLDQYPYYAPLGAVVAMSATVVDSVRASWQAAAAVCLGGAVSLGVQVLSLPAPAAIGLAVLVATLLAGVEPLGTMGGWVPTAALFALVLGSEHPLDYVAAYAGLLAFGALVAVLVNMALPQVPITPAARAAERLRGEVAAQLDDLAEGLAAEAYLTTEQWEERSRALVTHSHHVDTLIGQVREGLRANWRSTRWADEAERQYRLAHALVRLSDCVDDVFELVGDERTSVHADDAHSARVRAGLAQAMTAVAGLLRDSEPGDAEESEPARVAVRQVREMLDRVPGEAGTRLAATAITVNLQRAVDAWS
jgi:uncharacterized membrane protein YgaE (UPF0421/DUF939 family)